MPSHRAERIRNARDSQPHRGRHALVPSPSGRRRVASPPRGLRLLVGRAVTSPAAIGAAALALAVGGTLASASSSEPRVKSEPTRPASALAGSTGAASRLSDASRPQLVSRGMTRSQESRRLAAAAERQARRRDAALGRISNQARRYATWLIESRWLAPLEPVAITAEFGDYGLWSNYHTGIDFNGETGDPIRAIAAGAVTWAGYDGAYGYKTVVTLPDGTEIWYCHQDSISVGAGVDVVSGQVIGTVGSTGNVTGSHLHLEVRPGGGDPVDPRGAFRVHGVDL